MTNIQDTDQIPNQQEHVSGRAMPEATPYFRRPTLSPDGRYVAFCYAADIWQVAIEGGIAERLTVHSAGNNTPRYSPDGEKLAFTSFRTGHGDIYVLPMNGGDMLRLTYDDNFSSVEDWSPDGQHIFFNSTRESQGWAIFRVPMAGGTPALIAMEPFENLEDANVSPDGHTLAFNTTYNPWWRLGPDHYAPGRIWLMPLSEHATPDACRQRYHPLPPDRPAVLGPVAPYPLEPLTPYAEGRWPLWAPDGQGIYFVADHEGVENIWYMSLVGGEPRKVTHFTSGRLLWPAVARHAPTIVFEHEWQIWQFDLRSEETAPVPIRVRADTKITPVHFESQSRYFSEMTVAPDGKKLAIVAHGQIFADFADKETDREMRQGPAFRITNTTAREGQVTWTPDSNCLVYVSDRHSEQEIYCYDFIQRTETRLTHDLSPKILPCCSPDGKWIAYISKFETIFLLNRETGETHPLTQGNFVRSNGLAWSPDSRWLAYISHDSRFFCNVYVQRISEDVSHQITFLSNINGYGLFWSSDGRFLIFNSSQYHMESQIVRVDLAPPMPYLRETEFEKLFASEKPAEGSNQGEQPKEADSSPETAVANDEQPAPSESELDAAEDIQTSEKQEETEEQEPERTEESVAEESGKEKQKESEESKNVEVSIVFEGIERRLHFLTPIEMDATACDISHNSRDLLFLADVAGRVNIWTLPLDEPRQDQPPHQILATTSSKRAVQFAPNDKTFYYLDEGYITIRKFPNGRDPVVLHTRCDFQVDFDQEKMQVFHEAWRLLRDTFYDPTFRGKDWNEIRACYAPLAAGAQTRGDISTILNMMVGELRTSHLGASWQSRFHSSSGYTGLFFDQHRLREEQVLCIDGMLPDSPVALLSEPPRVGEYLVAVDGVAITPYTNVDALFQRTVRRRVVLTVASSPQGEQARHIAIRPMDEHAYAELRYRAWVATNEAFVNHISQGRLGYVHVREMTYNAYQQFLVNLDVETHSKEGIVLDIRYNRGGYIATFILDVLTRRSVVLSGFRDRLSTDAYHHSGNRALNKPTILVTNQSSASNAEIFTEIYRRLGLGKVVGKPTAGAVIGTVDRQLLNGVFFRLPFISISTPEGENLEGAGRAVDRDVAQPLGAWGRGHDFQLEAAVQTLLESLDQA